MAHADGGSTNRSKVRGVKAEAKTKIVSFYLRSPKIPYRPLLHDSDMGFPSTALQPGVDMNSVHRVSSQVKSLNQSLEKQWYA